MTPHPCAPSKPRTPSIHELLRNRQFVAANQAIRQSLRLGSTLRVALFHRAPREVLECILDQDMNSGLEVSRMTGSTLHTCLTHHPEHFPWLWNRLYEYEQQRSVDPEKSILLATNIQGHSVLHVLTQLHVGMPSPHPTLEWMQMVLRDCPRIVHVHNERGESALRTALCTSRRDDAVCQVLDLLLDPTIKDVCKGDLLIDTALLHGRSWRILERLPKDWAHQNTLGETTMILAATVGAPPDVWHLLEGSLSVRDQWNLTVLDWLWIRHVVDWFLPENSRHLYPHRAISRRRYLDPEFASQFVTCSSLKEIQTALEEDGYRATLLRDLVQRLQEACRHHPNALHALWTHKSCAGMRSAVVLLTNAVDEPDSSSRYWLHHACSQHAYCIVVPAGLNQVKTAVVERAYMDLPLNEMACLHRDVNGQLPLHVLLDTSKKQVRQLMCSGGLVQGYIPVILEALEKLWKTCPDSFGERYQGLLPFQLAAHGTGADVNVVYNLLRREPSQLWK